MSPYEWKPQQCGFSAFLPFRTRRLLISCSWTQMRLKSFLLDLMAVLTMWRYTFHHKQPTKSTQLEPWQLFLINTWTSSSTLRLCFTPAVHGCPLIPELHLRFCWLSILHGPAPLSMSQVLILHLQPSDQRLSCCLRLHSSDLEQREPGFYCFSSKNVEQTLRQHQNSWVRASFTAFKKPPAQTWIWRISSEVCSDVLMLLSVLSFLQEFFLWISWWSILLLIDPTE